VRDGAAGPLPGDARWNQQADPAQVASYVADWDLGWLDAASLPALSVDVFEYPMVDRDVLPQWGSGRVTLLGDAAHPMYPVGANGASQAIVDARTLADDLHGDTRKALRTYEDRRRRDTARVIAANRDMLAANTERGEDIARVTTKYRTDTERSTS
jgi:2-polyprenyl-6-methoxyphenol hydroxylase-like FAD-dependent oxidoreductase